MRKLFYITHVSEILCSLLISLIEYILLNHSTFFLGILQIKASIDFFHGCKNTDFLNLITTTIDNI